jgi:hypothetical protein
MACFARWHGSAASAGYTPKPRGSRYRIASALPVMPDSAGRADPAPAGGGSRLHRCEKWLRKCTFLYVYRRVRRGSTLCPTLLHRRCGSGVQRPGRAFAAFTQGQGISREGSGKRRCDGRREASGICGKGCSGNRTAFFRPSRGAPRLKGFADGSGILPCQLVDAQQIPGVPVAALNAQSLAMSPRAGSGPRSSVSPGSRRLSPARALPVAGTCLPVNPGGTKSSR